MERIFNGANCEVQPQNMPKVLIFSGPHGGGKDSIEQIFSLSTAGANRHIRYTSRAQAPDEADGVTYHYLSQKDFNAMSNAEKFIEHSTYQDGSTGTSYDDLVQQLNLNKFVSLTINFEDALTLKEKLTLNDITHECFFIAPCSEEEMLYSPDLYLTKLAQRMLKRGRPTDNILHRLEKAEEYRRLFVSNGEEFIYIANEDNGLDQAVYQIKWHLGEFVH